MPMPFLETVSGLLPFLPQRQETDADNALRDNEVPGRHVNSVSNLHKTNDINALIVKKSRIKFITLKTFIVKTYGNDIIEKHRCRRDTL